MNPPQRDRDTEKHLVIPSKAENLYTFRDNLVPAEEWDREID
jgi:hypothetical protein